MLLQLSLKRPPKIKKIIHLFQRDIEFEIKNRVLILKVNERLSKIEPETLFEGNEIMDMLDVLKWAPVGAVSLVLVWHTAKSVTERRREQTKEKQRPQLDKSKYPILFPDHKFH